MAVDDLEKYNKFLDGLASELDISPTAYNIAVDSYNAVGSWLNDDSYKEGEYSVYIYPQGSFELGTVVKPYDKDFGYDIDLVCQLSIDKEDSDPKALKKMVGDRLKDNKIYKDMLDEEGKRCWTLQYSEIGDFGFHLDVLPAIEENISEIKQCKNNSEYPELVDTSIAITNKLKPGVQYNWSTSNPRGFSEWFRRKNQTKFDEIKLRQKQDIFNNSKDIFKSVEDVPDRLVRTPLQKTIQLMKRHRDVRFSGNENEEYKPISMIITTLATHLYEGESNVNESLKNITNKMLSYVYLLTNKNELSPDGLIQKLPEGKWYIGNPVNGNENFADRWHEDEGARARAFFNWVSWLQDDVLLLERGIKLDDAINRTKNLIKNGVVERHKIEQKSIPVVNIKDPAKPWCSEV